MGWKPADKIAVALHNFKGHGLHQLPVHVGDLLYVQEECGEWLRGYLFYEPSRRGIFPSSFVSIKESTKRRIGSRMFVVPAGDDLIMEATQGLREWWLKLRDLYLHRSRERWRTVYHAMEEVVNWRRALLSSSTTLEALQDTKTRLSATIDELNRQSGCPLTPRDPATGAAVDCHMTSILDLWKLHRDRRADSTSDHTHGTLRRQRQEQPHAHLHHLYMRVDAIDHLFTEDCEIFFYLSGGGREQLSERYFISMAKGGDKKHHSVGDRKSCVFTDLGAKDLGGELYLVCQIIRNGKMLQDKKYHSSHTFRRPYACGVLDVRGVMKEKEISDSFDHHKKITMPLYLCGTNHESNFATFHTTVIQKTGAKGGQKPGCAITLTLRAFHRKQLSSVRREVPILFTKATQTVHKLGFPDVILPGDARNDIYVTLESGSFSKGTKTAERNVEVAINVVDRSGTVIPRSIVMGAGSEPCHEYVSFIYYHNNNPRWKETFKLAIPFEKVPDAHLRIVFRHLAKDESREKAEKSFSFAYLKVMKDDGSIISDGSHELYVYETGTKKWSDPVVYLSQASGREELIQSAGSSTMKLRKTLRGSSTLSQAARSFREVVTISTLTCSTKLTQRIELLLLLKWRQKSRDLSVVLKNLVHVGGEEVVKFLQDTLDCLFDILNDNNEKYGELVFEALVSIFGLMSDDRYHHFTTVLDIYIEKHFSALLAHKYLLATFKRNVNELMLADLQHPKLMKILQSMPYLFKFIVQSSHLHQKHQHREDTMFQKELSDVFSSFNKLMAIPETQLKEIQAVQKVLLECYPAIIPELMQIFSYETMALFISQFLESVRNVDSTYIPLQKLIFINAIMQSPVRLLDNEGSRRRLVPTVVKYLIHHMDYCMAGTQYKHEDHGNQEVVRCVGQLLGGLTDLQQNRCDEDVLYAVPLIHPLLSLCKLLPPTNKLSSPNMINFLMLLSLMTDGHFSQFFQSLQKNSFGDFILDLMEVLQSYVSRPPYPGDWCTLYLLQNRVLARTLINCSSALVEFTLDDKSFSPSVWDTFFLLCAKFLTQPCLQLEWLSDYRSHTYQQQFGDVRVTVGRHVVTLWHKLGDKKGNFIPNLVTPFLEISLIKHKELRHISLPLIMDIMVCEQQASHNFKRVETEVFDKIDELIASGRGDEEYRELFQEILHPLCAANNLGSAGEVFISCVSRLIGLLLDYRNVSSDKGHKDRRMGCMLNLLNFYREIEKEELYIRYIYKLADLHKKDQSFTEAGFTLLLRAKGLEWSIEPVPPEGRFKEEVEQMKVKEELYKEVIDLFDKGQAWEHGIPLCKELCGVYETEIQYTELAATLQCEAEFFQRIVRELRVEPEYFMVGSYGKGFPLFLRNKIFIHRGLPYERLASFIKRLTDDYSTAELLRSTKPPEDDIKNSTGMYLQVRSVQAIPEDQKRFEGKTVPDAVSRYYRANDVSKFRYDRPFHRGNKRKDCEIATLWLERTNFVTTKSFPGEMAWFEVASMEQVELDPLAIAIETVSFKTAEVRELTALHTENHSLNINPLSMLLSGLIDAAVGGGIKNYRIVFFNDEYIASNPGDEERVTNLKQLIEEQLAVLKKGLEVHGKRIAPALEGMQQNLEKKRELMVYEVFPERRKSSPEKMKTPPERRKKATRSNTVKNNPLPPIPQHDSPSKQSSLTLGNRRLTGKTKNRISVSQVPDSPTTPGASNMLQRSATTRTTRDSPKLPLPYQQRKPDLQAEVKRLSGSGSIEDSMISEVDERDYMSLDDFLPQDNVPAPPPKYTPPPPPGGRPEEVEHDYTPVKITDDGEVQVGQQPRPREEEEVWGLLPWQLKQSGPQRSPNAPHIQPLGTSPSGRPLLMPPEPTSPPPSPPTSTGKPTPPISRRFAGGGSEATDSPPEQPKLPPKKRRESSKLYSDSDPGKWRSSPPKPPPPVSEEIYFDKLTASRGHSEDVQNHLSVSPAKDSSPISSPSVSHSPSPGAPPTGDDVYSNHLAFKMAPKKPHPPAPPTSTAESDYFDHMAGPLPSKPPPNKPHPPAPPTSTTESDYFDHMAGPLPSKPPPNKPHPPAPPTSTTESDYFDHMAGPLPSKPPPNKPHPPAPPTSTTESDYFDHMAGPLPSKPPPNKPHPPAPPTSTTESDYFDHMAGPLPSKPPPNKPHPPAPPTSTTESDYFDHMAGPLPSKPPPPVQLAFRGAPEPPLTQREAPGSDVTPPPLPQKKGKPQRQASTSEEQPQERPIPRPRIDTQHPVPAPRTTPPRDSPSTPSRPPKPGAPVLPPKPLPPKPATKPVLPPKEDIQVPPIPAKRPLT